MRSSTPAAAQAWPGDAGPLVTHVTAQKATARRQATGDGERRHACEGPDLDGTGDSGEPCEGREQPGLVDADLHSCDVAQGTGPLDEIRLDRISGLSVREHVVGDRFGQQEGAW